MGKEIIFVTTLLTDQQLNCMNDCLSDKYIILTLKDNGVDVSEDVKDRYTFLYIL